MRINQQCLVLFIALSATKNVDSFSIPTNLFGTRGTRGTKTSLLGAGDANGFITDSYLGSLSNVLSKNPQTFSTHDYLNSLARLGDPSALHSLGSSSFSLALEQAANNFDQQQLVDAGYIPDIAAIASTASLSSSKAEISALGNADVAASTGIKLDAPLAVNVETMTTEVTNKPMEQFNTASGISDSTTIPVDATLNKLPEISDTFAAGSSASSLTETMLASNKIEHNAVDLLSAADAAGVEAPADAMAGARGALYTSEKAEQINTASGTDTNAHVSIDTASMDSPPISTSMNRDAVEVGSDVLDTTTNNVRHQFDAASGTLMDSPVDRNNALDTAASNVRSSPDVMSDAPAMLYTNEKTNSFGASPGSVVDASGPMNEGPISASIDQSIVSKNAASMSTSIDQDIVAVNSDVTEAATDIVRPPLNDMADAREMMYMNEKVNQFNAAPGTAADASGPLDVAPVDTGINRDIVEVGSDVLDTATDNLRLSSDAMIGKLPGMAHANEKAEQLDAASGVAADARVSLDTAPVGTSLDQDVVEVNSGVLDTAAGNERSSSGTMIESQEMMYANEKVEQFGTTSNVAPDASVSFDAMSEDNFKAQDIAEAGNDVLDTTADNVRFSSDAITDTREMLYTSGNTETLVETPDAAQGVSTSLDPSFSIDQRVAEMGGDISNMAAGVSNSLDLTPKPDIADSVSSSFSSLKAEVMPEIPIPESSPSDPTKSAYWLYDILTEDDDFPWGNGKTNQLQAQIGTSVDAAASKIPEGLSSVKAAGADGMSKVSKGLAFKDPGNFPRDIEKANELYTQSSVSVESIGRQLSEGFSSAKVAGADGMSKLSKGLAFKDPSNLSWGNEKATEINAQAGVSMDAVGSKMSEGFGSAKVAGAVGIGKLSKGLAFVGSAGAATISKLFGKRTGTSDNLVENERSAFQGASTAFVSGTSANTPEDNVLPFQMSEVPESVVTKLAAASPIEQGVVETGNDVFGAASGGVVSSDIATDELSEMAYTNEPTEKFYETPDLASGESASMDALVSGNSIDQGDISEVAPSATISPDIATNELPGVLDENQLLTNFEQMPDIAAGVTDSIVTTETSTLIIEQGINGNDMSGIATNEFSGMSSMSDPIQQSAEVFDNVAVATMLSDPTAASNPIKESVLGLGQAISDPVSISSTLSNTQEDGLMGASQTSKPIDQFDMTPDMLPGASSSMDALGGGAFVEEHILEVSKTASDSAIAASSTPTPAEAATGDLQGMMHDSKPMDQFDQMTNMAADANGYASKPMDQFAMANDMISGAGSSMDATAGSALVGAEAATGDLQGMMHDSKPMDQFDQMPNMAADLNAGKPMDQFDMVTDMISGAGSSMDASAGSAFVEKNAVEVGKAASSVSGDLQGMMHDSKPMDQFDQMSNMAADANGYAGKPMNQFDMAHDMISGAGSSMDASAGSTLVEEHIVEVGKTVSGSAMTTLSATISAEAATGDLQGMMHDSKPMDQFDQMPNIAAGTRASMDTVPSNSIGNKVSEMGKDLSDTTITSFDSFRSERPEVSYDSLADEVTNRPDIDSASTMFDSLKAESSKMIEPVNSVWNYDNTNEMNAQMSTSVDAVTNKVAEGLSSVGNAEAEKIYKLSDGLASASSDGTAGSSEMFGNLVRAPGWLVEKSSTAIAETGQIRISDLERGVVSGLEYVGHVFLDILDTASTTFGGPAVSELLESSQASVNGVVNGAIHSVIKTANEIGDMSVSQVMQSLAALVTTVVKVLFQILGIAVKAFSGKSISEWSIDVNGYVGLETNKLMAQVSATAADFNEKSLAELVDMMGSFLHFVGTLAVEVFSDIFAAIEALRDPLTGVLASNSADGVNHAVSTFITHI